MKLTEETIKVLTNFAEINPNLVVKDSSNIKTISENKTMVANATLEQTFPQEFGIYDLGSFLRSINLIGESELEFKPEYILIKGAGKSLKYFLSDPEYLTYPQSNIKDLGDASLSIEFSWEQIKDIKTAASALKVERLQVYEKDGSIVGSVLEPGNDTSNVYSITFEDAEDNKDFEYNIHINTLRLLQDDYSVSFYDAGLAIFKAKTKDITYYIPLDKS